MNTDRTTRRSFLKEAIAPYYEKLCLGNEPTTLEEFKLPPLRSDLSRHLRLSTPTAQQVLTHLKTAHAEAVYKCETALEDLLCEPSQAAFAIAEEFLDRILRAAGVESGESFLQARYFYLHLCKNSDV